MRGLKNKVILVTGGNGLIGRAIVKRLREELAVVVNADVSCGTDWASGNVEADVTNPDAVEKLIEDITAKFGRIDGLVNNAYPRTADWGNRWEDVTLEAWKKNVDMQLNAVFDITQRVTQKMTINKTGSIVNIASIYGVVGNDFTVYSGTTMTSPAAYAAIKGGLINFTRYLASYLGPQGIRVNCVSPGGIENNQNQVFIKNYENKVPLKHMGKPDDISPAVAFLLSDDASYITGHNLIVDGGWTAI
jgi:NAD(P)-dependent dehydrogenase (short-subunit alcohol dehydrogenase family)